MARTYPSADRVRELLDYDPKTGRFRWRTKAGRGFAGNTAGSIAPSGYVIIGIDKQSFPAHRLAWLFVHGVLPSGEIDHMDMNPANNAIANLRDVPRSLNQQNRRAARIDNKCGLLGVSRNKSKKHPWQARIRVGDRQRYIGSFATKEDAHAAYVAEKARTHPGSLI